jgi:two-component system chemotaxis response regulator CheY
LSTTVGRQTRAPSGGSLDAETLLVTQTDYLAFVLQLAIDVAVERPAERVLAQANLPLGKVLEAGDGQEAIAALKQQTVGLILSDINMPNMDGLQLLGELKANDRWKHVPVLIISTEGSQTKVMEAVQLGACGFVRKPFTANQIKEKLATIL